MPHFPSVFMEYQRLWFLMNPARCFPLDKQEVPVDWDKFRQPPPLAVQQIAVGSAISSLLEVVGYVGPDQEGGPDPNGPLGPYIRDALIGLSIAQLASQVSDAGLAREMRSVAARVVRDQADRIGTYSEGAESS